MKKFNIINKNYSNYLYSLILVFFIYEFLKFLFFKSFLYSFKNSWAFSEYFINYSGGFIRRGLIGEFTQLTSKIFSFLIPNNYIENTLFVTVKEFQFITYQDIEEITMLPYLAFIISLGSLFHIVYFLYKKTYNFLLINKLLLLFSPFGIIYFIRNLDTFFGRKELLFINLLIYYLNKSTNISKPQVTYFFLLALSLSLSYELLIFFIPLFWTILNVEKKDKLYKSIIFFILTIVNLLLIFKYSVSKNFASFKLICDDIYLMRISLKLDELQCWGAPRYLDSRYVSKNSQFELFFLEVSLGLKQNILFWIFVILIFLLFIYLFNFFNSRGLFLFIPFLGLFLIAQDYGRWFFLIFLIVVLYGTEPMYDKKFFNLAASLIVTLSGLIIDIPVYLNY